VTLNWRPTETDLRFTRNLIHGLRDGGQWQIPRNNSTWRIDKTNKVFICFFGPKDELFEMTAIVAKELGYATRYEVERKPFVIDATSVGSGKALIKTTLPVTDINDLL